MLITNEIISNFLQTRIATEEICAPLTQEDYVVQPIVDVSPPKWHLGHTTWFFEDFILKKYKTDYQEYDSNFSFVFNSYYESMGARVVRTDRGNLSRPTVEEVYAYRKHVTHHLKELLEQTEASEELQSLIEIGIHHEKQHQELLLTDIKYILGNNPLQPMYTSDFSEYTPSENKQEWIHKEEGIYEIGHQDDSFCYDNELAHSDLATC